MSTARASFGVFVLGGCMYAAGGSSEAEQSVEKYDPSTDSWSDVNPMLGEGRVRFCAQSVTTRAEVAEENLFDNLIAKAEAERRGRGVRSLAEWRRPSDPKKQNKNNLSIHVYTRSNVCLRICLVAKESTSLSSCGERQQPNVILFRLLALYPLKKTSRAAGSWLRNSGEGGEEGEEGKKAER